MAAFNYQGMTYFYANGKWLDPGSKRVSAELSEQLDLAFSKKKIQETERKQRTEHKQKTVEQRVSSAAKHKKAREIPYRRAAVLTQDQKRALQVLESGENVFLSGEAGTGKSFVLNEYIRSHKNKNMLVCAPTGIAAINVGGATLHRVFKVPVSVIRPGELNTKPDRSIQKADVIIIDEISMCRFDIFEYVVRTIRNAERMEQNKAEIQAMSEGRVPKLIKPKQIIVVGDFYQLAPVITPADREVLATYWDMDSFGDGFAFESPLWQEQNFRNVVLKEIVRQKGDKDFVMNLNRIRRGDVGGIRWFNENTGRIPIPDSIYLCGTNRAADTINEQESEGIPGEPTVYSAKTSGQVQMSDKMTKDTLELKVGMQVMTVVNDIEEGYQNGSIGKIVWLKKDSVGVELDTGKIVSVKPYDWEILGYEVQEDELEKIVLGNFKQIPLKVAYAITIHKSQGQTYTSANIAPDCFAVGQLYVALSRVQTIEGMTLEHDIRGRALKTSRYVQAFYENLREE